MFQLVHVAARAFPRVALYFENSILAPDLKLLPSAAAVVARYEESANRTLLDSPQGVGLTWSGPANVDGKVWPVSDGATLWLPAGTHIVETTTQQPVVRLLDFNGNLKAAASLPNGIEFTYDASARAIAILDKQPDKIELDGVPVQLSGTTLLLPRGKHAVRARVPTLAPAQLAVSASPEP